MCNNFSEIPDRITICYQLNMFEGAGMLSIMVFVHVVFEGDQKQI